MKTKTTRGKVALVSARSSSARFPGKCLMNVAPGVSVVEWILARLKYYDFFPILCTSLDESDDALAAVGHLANVPTFRGSLKNKVQRWEACMDHFGIENAYLADGDDPFFSGEYAHLSLQQLRKNRCLAVLPSERSDAGEAYVGTSVTVEALRILTDYASKNDIHEIDVVPWSLLSGSVEVFAADFPESARPRFRLTLDYWEDLVLLRELCSRFSVEAEASEVHDFLLENRHLVELNFSRNVVFNDRKKLQLEGLREKPRDA